VGIPNASRQELQRALDASLRGQLREDLVRRRVRSGLRALEENGVAIRALHPGWPGAASFVGLCALWADSGFGDVPLVKELLSRFSRNERALLPLGEYVAFRMAEGFVAMKEEALVAAIQHFDFVLSLEAEFADPDLMAMAYFWKAQCHRKSGEYQEAAMAVARGRQHAESRVREELAAMMQALEGWLAFQNGRLMEARQILKQAEEVLRRTDDFVTLGNIFSAYGRIAQADGAYEDAARYFAASIDEIAKADRFHRNLARSLGNLAYVKRLMARQLRQRIDALARRRISKTGPAQTGGATKLFQVEAENATSLARIRTQFEKLQAEAVAHLEQALAIFSHERGAGGAAEGSTVRHSRGEGNLRITYGHIFLDNGDFERAEREARIAYQRGRDKNDSILLARSRLLSCMIENTKMEEGLLEGGDLHEEVYDPSRHAQLAERYGLEAVEAAKHTQNQQLLSRTYIWLGLTQSSEYLHNIEGARQSLNLALSFMKADPYQPHWDDLKTLKTRVLGGGDIDETLRAWSQGAVGTKSFRQISEEFADFIIPKVWNHEDRKIARVARRLSISPKKVRRVLSRAGLLDSGDE
jgi:tetratricopeptide (TPR) repeat protein